MITTVKKRFQGQQLWSLFSARSFFLSLLFHWLKLWLKNPSSRGKKWKTLGRSYFLRDTYYHYWHVQGEVAAGGRVAHSVPWHALLQLQGLLSSYQCLYLAELWLSCFHFNTGQTINAAILFLFKHFSLAGYHCYYNHIPFNFQISFGFVPPSPLVNWFLTVSGLHCPCFFRKSLATSKSFTEERRTTLNPCRGK